jgi:hypothetical protein
MVRVLNHDALDKTIGSIVTRWSTIETNLRVLIYDLAAYHAADYENDNTFQVLSVLISNMDMREAVANAKALSHQVQDPPDFFPRAEALLNLIDNTLRIERNRCVHDRWFVVGPIISRVKSGTIVRNAPATGERKAHPNTVRQYFGLGELTQLADQLDDAASQVIALGDELRATMDRLRPLPE